MELNSNLSMDIFSYLVNSYISEGIFATSSASIYHIAASNVSCNHHVVNLLKL